MEKVEDQNPKAPRCGTTPLHLAAIKGHLNVCHYIFSQVLDLNPKDANGSTPLFKVAMYGHFDTCKLIIDKAEDENPECKSGFKPLFTAAFIGNLEAVKESRKI